MFSDRMTIMPTEAFRHHRCRIRKNNHGLFYLCSFISFFKTHPSCPVALLSCPPVLIPRRTAPTALPPSMWRVSNPPLSPLPFLGGLLSLPWWSSCSFSSPSVTSSSTATRHPTTTNMWPSEVASFSFAGISTLASREPTTMASLDTTRSTGSATSPSCSRASAWRSVSPHWCVPPSVW